MKTYKKIHWQSDKVTKSNTELSQKGKKGFSSETTVPKHDKKFL